MGCRYAGGLGQVFIGRLTKKTQIFKPGMRPLGRGPEIINLADYQG